MDNSLNNIAFQIGEYLIYPALIILVLLIIVVITILFVAFMAVNKSSTKKNIRHIYHITKWQKQELANSIDYAYEIKDTDSELKSVCLETDEYIDDFIDYVNNNKYWNIDDLFQINESLPINISYLLLQDVKASCFDPALYDIDRAVLLLHSIDLINGGADMDGKKYLWMDESIEEAIGDSKSSNENRMRTIFFMALDNVAEYFREEEGEDGEKVFGDISADAPYYVRDFTYSDYESAYDDLASKTKIKDLTEDTKKMITAGLIDALIEYTYCNTTSIDKLTLCTLRSLACLLDNNDYDVILKSLND